MPFATSRKNATANKGSMPDVALVSALMVPVWAIAVTVALRVPFSVRLSLVQEDNEKLGKLPRLTLDSVDVLRASSLMNFMSFSANSSAFGES